MAAKGGNVVREPEPAKKIERYDANKCEILPSVRCPRPKRQNSQQHTLWGGGDQPSANYVPDDEMICLPTVMGEAIAH